MTPFRAGLLLVIGILSVAAMIGFLFFANIELTSPVSAGTSPTRIIDSPTDTEARATLQAAVDFVTSVAKGTPQNGQTPTAPASTPVAIGQSFTLNGTLYTVNQVADPEPPGFFNPPPASASSPWSSRRRRCPQPAPTPSASSPSAATTVTTTRGRMATTSRRSAPAN